MAAPAFASQAHADGFPVRQPVPVYEAVPALWTGFYIGANVGAGLSEQALSRGQSSSGGYDVAADGVMLGDGTTSGVIGGGQIGYNYQMGHFVLGVEGEISASGVGGHVLLHPFGASGDLNSEVDWVGTLTGRIGVVFHNDTLFYVKGGVAWDEYKYKLSTVNPFAAGIYPSKTDSRTGWVLGFGTEYAISPQWSAKIEYNYIDFGTERVGFAQGTGDEGVTGPFSTEVDQSLHVFKIGINHKLGGYADYTR